MDTVRRLSGVFLLVLLPATTGAQGLTGSLSGTVKDTQGGVLAGAVVRVTSPTILGGELRTTTSDRGQWRFPVLPPGSYELTAELAPRFAAYREEGLIVGAGSTLYRTLVLKLEGVAESITVVGSARIEARGSGLETRFGPEYLETIPTRRFSMFDVIKSAPGMSPTSPGSGTVNTVSAFGSGVNENTFMIDGTNFTCPCQGVSRAEPSVDVIQEVHVQSMGASVEYGNLQGAVFNVITKQGGPRFQYDASYYGQVSGLTAQPFTVPVSKGTQASSGYERVRYRDFTTSLGGPAVRDRVWFFGAYQYLRDYDSQPGADPAFPRKYEQNKVFGKVTSQLTSALRMMQSFHEEVWVNPTPPTLATPFVATQRLHATVPSMTFVNLTHVLSSNTVWDVRVGRFGVDQKGDPSTGDRSTPNRFDQTTGTSSGNIPQIDTLWINRVTMKAVLQRYQAGWLGADHELKVGTQVERGEHRTTQTIPGGVRFTDREGAPFLSVSRAPSIGGGEFITSAVFASDSIALTSRVTANAGVRFDHSRAISPDVPALDADGFETDGTTKGLGTLYTWNTLSPRLGIAARLTADGRTTLRANYGRFNQGVLTGELSPIHPGVTTITMMEFEAATQGYTKFVSAVDPRINLALDPQTRTPRTDEYSVAVEREIARQLAASVAYVRKTGSEFISWTDIAGQYRQDTRTLADGTSLPVQVLTSSTASRRFLLTNPSGYSLDYEGLVVALEKRLSRGWQASGSYTFSRAQGLQATVVPAAGAAAAEAQLSTVAPNTVFGRDPNDLTNARGRLPNDRPHIFRATGVAHLPWQNILVAANLQWFSGKPWAATAQVSLPQGSQRILVEPRGSRRLSSQSLLDFRVSKRFSVGSAGTIDLRLDVLNLLNDTAEEALASDVQFTSSNQRNASFGQPTLFMDPRRAMLSVRLNLGS
jgi:hypothetical protein